jgi:cytochrome P450 enzyme
MGASADTATRDPFLDLVEADDPAPILHRLRDEDPVHFVETLGFWFVTRHDDVKRLFNDPQNVTQNRSAWEHHVPAPAGSMRRWLEDESLMARGPEEHLRFRRLFRGALTPRAVRRMAGQVQDVVERFAAPLRDRPGEVIDLLGDFTNPIPNTVISRIVGVEAGPDEVRFREIAQEMIRGFFPFAPADAVERAESALRELAPWVRSMVAERGRAPREDLISDLLRAQDEGEPIDEDEIAMLVSVLIGAGSETTNLGGMQIIQTLLEHPEPLEQVRGDRGLVPRAVEEIMRFAFGGPAGMQRFAVRDFELRGKTIRKGQMLMLALGGANRDPVVFPKPDVLDLGRDNRETLVFGHGPHYCLGANLARQELAAMLDAALDIVPPGSRVREDLQQFAPMGLFKRPLNLPIEIARR